MVENKATSKQLELSNRILKKLIDEKEILLERFDIISNTELGAFIKDDMNDIEQSIEYLGTIQRLQCNSIENRLIQIEGEIEGVKLHIEELKEAIKNDSK